MFCLNNQPKKHFIWKSIYLWTIGGFVFGVIELCLGMVIYPWIFQYIYKFIFGMFMYVFISSIGGAILGYLSWLFIYKRKKGFLKNLQIEAFNMASSISFIAFIWGTIWILIISRKAGLEPRIYYFLDTGMIFISCILWLLAYQFLKSKEKSKRLIFFIGLSSSIYTFLITMGGMYTEGYFVARLLNLANLMYILLGLVCGIIGFVVIYYISMLLIGFNRSSWYSFAAILAVAVVVTIYYKYSGKINRKKPNVLLLTVDSLRADSLSCYGYDKIKTKSIDHLASNGILFDKAISQAPWTLASFSSILTSLYPTIHGAQRISSTKWKMNSKNFYKINDNVRLLPETLKENGYSTQAFADNVFISSLFGLNRGFDNLFNFIEWKNIECKTRKFFLWTFFLKSGKAIYDNNRNTEITKRAINWLESNTKQTFFLWVHYLDPHLPYERSKSYNLDPGYSGKLKDDSYVRTLDRDSIRSASRAGEYNLSDKHHFKSIYDEEILSVDENIGLLLKKLDELNLLDNMLIIFTSDHGEEFWDHGEYEHGHTLYWELVHVPLIIQFPKILPHGMKISYQVRSIDIMPTILEMLGIEHNLNINGKSLLPLIKGKEVGDRIAFSESLHDAIERKAIRTGGYSFIYFPDSRKKELYDLKNDPLELNNVIDKQTDVSDDLESKLLNWLKESHNRAKILETERHSKPVKLKKENKDALKSLGYL